MKIKLNITTDDIRDGGMSIHSCMVAKSLERALTEQNIEHTSSSVGISTAGFWRKREVWDAQIPKDVQQKIIAFHLDRASVSPFEVELEFNLRGD